MNATDEIIKLYERRGDLLDEKDARERANVPFPEWLLPELETVNAEINAYELAQRTYELEKMLQGPEREAAERKADDWLEIPLDGDTSETLGMMEVFNHSRWLEDCASLSLHNRLTQGERERINDLVQIGNIMDDESLPADVKETILSFYDEPTLSEKTNGAYMDGSDNTMRGQLRDAGFSEDGRP